MMVAVVLPVGSLILLLHSSPFLVTELVLPAQLPCWPDNCGGVGFCGPAGRRPLLASFRLGWGLLFFSNLLLLRARTSDVPRHTAAIAGASLRPGMASFLASVLAARGLHRCGWYALLDISAISSL